MKKILALILSTCIICLCLVGCDDENDWLYDDIEGIEDVNDIEDIENTDDIEDVEDAEDTEDVEEVESEVTSGEASESTWTILFYLCGSDLESEGGAATANLAEICSLYLSENINFLVETGGCAEWQNDLADSDYLERYIITDGEMTFLSGEELASMGEADTLGSFLKWGVEEYPADKYMVTIWNHGGGSVAGVAFDELYDDDSLDLNEIADGISQAGVNFEIIGFDACLMATLENAVKLAPYGNYLIASEEYEPGGGWDYDGWLDYLNENTGCTGLELSKAICDTYYDKCDSSGDGEMATLSVTDLSKIDALDNAFKQMATELTGITTNISSFRQFSRGASRAENYGGNTDEEGYTNMVDLGDLVANTENILTDTAEDVKSAIEEAVVYLIKGENRASSTGISVFYPICTDGETCDKYAEVTDNVDYLKFIDTVCRDWEAPSWVYEQAGDWAEDVISANDYNVMLSNYIHEDGFFVLNIEEGLEAVSTVLFTLYYRSDEAYIKLGLDNDINSDYDNGVFVDNFRNVWPAIGDVYVAPELIAEEDDYNLYSVPAILNGTETNLRCVYDFITQKFKIIGAYDGIDSNTGMSSRDVKKLKEGDELTFIADYIDDYGYEGRTELGTIIYDSSTIMEEQELVEGYYLYQYQVTDIFGERTYSDYVIMEYTDGETYIYEY